MEINDYILTATSGQAARMEKPLKKNWLARFWLLALVLVLLLGLRVIHLTVLKGGQYQQIAKGNSVRSIIIKAPRGRIYDAKGSLLVDNLPSMDVVVVPAGLPRAEEERKKMSEKLAQILDLDFAEVWSHLEKPDFKSLNAELIKENISQDQALILTEQATLLAGVEIEKTGIREYYDGKVFAHLLGYEGKIERKELEQQQGYLLTDYIGKQGLEKAYENYLRGVHGATQVEVDAVGNPKREVGIINPKPGSDLILNIEGDLQRKLYESLSKILEQTKTKTAAAVAINPQNGKVLALVNLPSFDNNLFARKISQQDYAGLIQDPDKPLFNRAISGEYPPGSTLKPLIAVAALSEGVIDGQTVINGLGGTLRVGNFSFRDWTVHGPSDVRKAIAQSNDIFFYTIGGGYGNIAGLGMGRMKKYENLFNLGVVTGIDLGGEATGLIPDEQWKLDKLGERWYVGNSYHAAIGQGYVTTTPLQIANYIAAIANGGKLYAPRIVGEVRKGDGETVEIESPVVRKDFIDPEVIRIVREGMRQTITDGTAQTLKNLPVAVAGKTGTAQFGNEDKTHGWFVSFAPYENPQIALAILVEGGGEGHSSAVPVTKEVYEWYFGSRNQ